MATHPKIQWCHSAGCVSRRVHPGTPPKQGCVGTNDPAVWRHLLWFDGKVYAAETKSDIVSHVPTFPELVCHFKQWHGTGKSPWQQVIQ